MIKMITQYKRQMNKSNIYRNNKQKQFLYYKKTLPLIKQHNQPMNPYQIKHKK